tara:strand:+ start:738 stop:1904 length:1167 start_codon:yes stop_codon:yes gene_type:complete
MARPKKKPKSQVISGGLSTSEKLASKNPAIRDEGRRETANQPQREQRQATERRAAALTGRGFSGVVGSALDVKGPTQEQVASAFAKRGEPEQIQPAFVPNQGKELAIDPLAGTPAEQPLAQQETSQEETTASGNFENVQEVLKFALTQEDPVIRQELIKSAAGGVIAGAGAVAVTTGLLATAAPLMGAYLAKGSTILTTIGLTSPNVAKAARGGFGAFSREAAGIPRMNTVTAKKLLSLSSKAASGKKFVNSLKYMAGNVVLNGFLEEEADQNVNHAIQLAQNEGDLQRADELIAFREEYANWDFWRVASLTIPLKGVIEYFETAALSVKGQKKKNDRLKAGKLTPSEQKFADIREEQRERDKRFDEIRQETRERDARFDKRRNKTDK